MPIIEIDYLVKPQIVNKKIKPIYFPSVPIRISIDHKMFPYKIDCLLDSGADYNLFPADIGISIGINIKKGEKVEHIGIGNVGIMAYRHPIKIFLDGYNFKTEAHFSFDHKIPLLGRDGFFKYFHEIVFNEKAKKLNLHY